MSKVNAGWSFGAGGFGWREVDASTLSGSNQVVRFPGRELGFFVPQAVTGQWRKAPNPDWWVPAGWQLLAHQMLRSANSKHSLPRPIISN